MTSRLASRLFLFDDDGQRILLFRYERDDHSPFWATPGGGLEGAESFEDAAIREAREELGIESTSLTHVGSRRTRFVSAGREIEQEEHYWVVSAGARPDLARALSAHRTEGILEARFWTRDELAKAEEPIFPTELAGAWWDGATALLRPSEVDAQLRAAYAFDRIGAEHDAARFYDRAFALGVPEPQRREFLVGYGSTLRNVGRLEDSERVLRAAIADYPRDDALPAFLALTLHARVEHGAAVATLLQLLLRFREHSPGIERYAKALGHYAKAVSGSHDDLD